MDLQLKITHHIKSHSAVALVAVAVVKPLLQRQFFAMIPLNFKDVKHSTVFQCHFSLYCIKLSHHIQYYLIISIDT